MTIGPHVPSLPAVLMDMNIIGGKTMPARLPRQEGCALDTPIMFVHHALIILSKELVEAAIGEMDVAKILVLDVQHLVGVIRGPNG